jgi:hypothetical protein
MFYLWTGVTLSHFAKKSQAIRCAKYLKAMFGTGASFHVVPANPSNDPTRLSPWRIDLGHHSRHTKAYYEGALTTWWYLTTRPGKRALKGIY